MIIFRYLPRFSLGTAMMLVLATGSACALFLKVRLQFDATPVWPSWRNDVAAVIVLGIALTALALGSMKQHSASHILFQVTLAYLGLLSLLCLPDRDNIRWNLYWFPAIFAILVAFPLAARGRVKTRMERGPRRTWWKNNLEARAFAFANLVLVLLAVVIEEFFGLIRARM